MENGIIEAWRNVLKSALIISMFTVVSGCSMFGFRSVEEAVYSLEAKDGDFEIRRYEPLMMAVTTSSADVFDDATDTTFNRLFKYISGNNIKAQDIEMTAPVFSSNYSVNKGESIDMTSPVIAKYSEQDEREWSLAFVLPKEFNESNSPLPSDPLIKLVNQPEKVVAVRTFSGLWSQERFVEETRKLERWIQKNGYRSVGTSMFAGYDPPWTLPFLRRNEVLVELVK